MSEDEITELEETIPALAVEALRAAQQRAMASGRDVVMLVGRDVVRISQGRTTVIKTLPPPCVVTERKKQATT